MVLSRERPSPLRRPVRLASISRLVSILSPHLRSAHPDAPYCGTSRTNSNLHFDGIPATQGHADCLRRNASRQSDPRRVHHTGYIHDRVNPRCAFIRTGFDRRLPPQESLNLWLNTLLRQICVTIRAHRLEQLLAPQLSRRGQPLWIEDPQRHVYYDQLWLIRWIPCGL